MTTHKRILPHNPQKERNLIYSELPKHSREAAPHYDAGSQRAALAGSQHGRLMIRFSIATMDSATEPGGLHQMLTALQGDDFQQILSQTVNQGQPGAAPASQRTIDALERVQPDSTTPDQCPVCFDDITGQAVCALLA